MEIRHALGPFVRECSAFVIIVELRRREDVSPGNFFSSFCGVFGKTTPYGKIFIILFRKFTWRHWLTLLCSNVINFVPRKIDEIVLYLPDKKNFGSPSSCRYCANRAQNLPGQPPTFGSHCSEFHPNWFTFGGVIAECVKIVLLAHWIFAVFTRALGE